MSYDSVETGLLDVIILHSDYSSDNATKGDYRILGAGVVKAVVLTPGTFSRSVTAAPRRMGTTWAINLELFIPFRRELSLIATELRTFRQDLIDQIDKYPKLNGTSGVIDAIVEGGSEPELWQGENQRWWVQKMRCIVKERVTVTIAE